VSERDPQPEPQVIGPWSRDETIPERSAYAVKLPVFEGPLDLLLHLIRLNEVDISDIPIAQIAEQYLKYLDLMRLVDIDVAADYLVMAATLAYIKSRMLLPASEAEDEEAGDPRAELARRLAEYAAFQEVAAELGQRPLLGRDVFPAHVDTAEIPEKEPELSVSLFELLEALRRVLESIPPEARHHEVSLERVTLQERMLAVMDRLREEPDGAILFERLLMDAARTRHLVVMTFLSLLELAKIQAIKLFQNSTEEGRPFGPVRVRLAIAPEEAPRV
jgi:segregation and condensation protein A